jgi:hypothetical protein
MRKMKACFCKKAGMRMWIAAVLTIVKNEKLSKYINTRG